MTSPKWYSFLFCLLIVSISCNENEKKAKPPFPSPNKIESLKKAAKEYPDSLMIVQDLIEAYRDEGLYDSALALTDLQIKKDSGNAYLWNIRATLYFENEDTAHAIQSLEQAISIYPLPGSARKNLKGAAYRSYAFAGFFIFCHEPNSRFFACSLARQD